MNIEHEIKKLICIRTLLEIMYEEYTETNFHSYTITLKVVIDHINHLIARLEHLVS